MPSFSDLSSELSTSDLSSHNDPSFSTSSKVQHVQEIRNAEADPEHQLNEPTTVDRSANTPVLSINEVHQTTAPRSAVLQTKVSFKWRSRASTEPVERPVRWISAQQVKQMTELIPLRITHCLECNSTSTNASMSDTKRSFLFSTPPRKESMDLQFGESVKIFGHASPGPDPFYHHNFPIQLRAYGNLCDAVGVIKKINDSKCPSTAQAEHQSNLDLFKRTISSTWKAYRAALEQRVALQANSDSDPWEVHRDTLRAGLDTMMLAALYHMSDAYMLVLAFEAALARSKTFGLNIWPETLDEYTIVNETIRKTWKICDEVWAMVEGDGIQQQDVQKAACEARQETTMRNGMHLRVDQLPDIRLFEEYLLRSLATEKWIHRVEMTHRRKGDKEEEKKNGERHTNIRKFKDELARRRQSIDLAAGFAWVTEAKQI